MDTLLYIRRGRRVTGVNEHYHRHIHRALRAQAFWGFMSASVSARLHRGAEPDTLPGAQGWPMPYEPLVWNVSTAPPHFLTAWLGWACGLARECSHWPARPALSNQNVCCLGDKCLVPLSGWQMLPPSIAWILHLSPVSPCHQRLHPSRPHLPG